MVNYQEATLDRVFAALADPTRRAILGRLAAGEARVTELAAPFDMSLPAVSKHLRVLERAGLLARERDGRVHRIELAPEPLRAADRWLESYRRFWGERLDSLARYLERPTPAEESWPRTKRRTPPRSVSSARSPRRPRRSSTRGRNRRH